MTKNKNVTALTFSQSVRRRVNIALHRFEFIDPGVNVHKTYYCDLLLS